MFPCLIDFLPSIFHCRIIAYIIANKHYGLLFLVKFRYADLNIYLKISTPHWNHCYGSSIRNEHTFVISLSFRYLFAEMWYSIFIFIMQRNPFLWRKWHVFIFSHWLRLKFDLHQTPKFVDTFLRLVASTFSISSHVFTI